MRILLALLLALPCFAQLKTDIEYARRPTGPLTLDVYTPEDKGPHPTVIIVHGGGWEAGDKVTYIKPLFPMLRDAGFAYVSINYRLAPQHRFPDPVRDVEDAIRWVMKHAGEYNLDTKRIALTGESAGGHLVAYVATTSAKKLGIRGVIPIYAPVDLLDRARGQGSVSKNVRQLLDVDEALTAATERKLREASPLTYANRNMPPILLIHGTEDASVPYKQSMMFLQRMGELGVPCELVTVGKGPHGMEAWEKLGLTQWKEPMVEWLVKTLK